MTDYTNSIVKVNFKSLYNSSFGKTLFLCLDILSKVDIFYEMFTEEEVKVKLEEFFKDSTHFLKEKTEVEIIQDFLRELAPFMQVIPQFMKMNTNYDFKEEELIVNIKNLKFFINNIWPLLVTNIIKNNISIYDYTEKDKIITRFNISEIVILNMYPKNISIEDCVEMFLTDLQYWLYYNCFTLKNVTTKRQDNHDIITITI